MSARCIGPVLHRGAGMITALQLLLDGRELLLAQAIDGDDEALAAAADIETSYRLLQNFILEENAMRKSIIEAEDQHATAVQTGAGVRVFKRPFDTGGWRYFRGCQVPNGLHVPPSAYDLLPPGHVCAMKPHKLPDPTPTPVYPPVKLRDDSRGDPVALVRAAVKVQTDAGCPRVTALDRVSAVAPNLFLTAKARLSELDPRPFRRADAHAQL
jgi:hypothetical protein